MSLVSSSDCAIVLVHPTKQHLSQLGDFDRDRLSQRVQLVVRAAAAAGAPCHVLSGRQHESGEDWLTAPSSPTDQFIHRTGELGSSWSNSGLSAALAAHNRSVLIIAGFWLETSVSFIALCALSGGFEVFLPLDITPPLDGDSRGPACDRLVQAGIVPTTAGQMIAEWIEQTSDATLRARLADLQEVSTSAPRTFA
jgi:hypothetical protein